MPLPYLLMLICDRWPGAGAPWDLERHPDSDRIRYYINMMGLEAEFKGDLDGLGPRDEMDWGDDD